MNKNIKILTICIGVLLVLLVPLLTNTLSAADPVYGPLGAYNVFVKNDYQQDSSAVEGRVAVGNDYHVDGEGTTIAEAYNSEGVFGYLLTETDYPSLIVSNQINLNSALEIIDGEIAGLNINDETLLNMATSDFSFSPAEKSKLSESNTYFTSQADELVETLNGLAADENDPVKQQENVDAFYDDKDKSLQIIDLPGQEIESETISEVAKSSTVESAAVQSVEASDENSEVKSQTSEPETTEYTISSELNVHKIDITNFVQHEKIIIRSDADRVNFKSTKITVDGEEVDLTDINNNSESMEHLADDIVWVFPNAKQVNLTDAQVTGSILAPEANTVIDSGVLNGQLYTNNLTQTNESRINNFVDFANEYDFDRTINYSTLTLEFVDTDGKELRPSESYKREVGTTFMTTIEAIDGYTALDSDQIADLEAGYEIPAEDKTITLTYESSFEATLTVYHQLEDGTNIVDPIVTPGKIGDVYSTDPLNDEAYELLETPANATGTLAEKTDVHYVYGVAGSTVKATITHQLADGTKLTDPKTVEVTKSAPYDFTDKIIKNMAYTYKGVASDSDPIKGTAGKTDLNIKLNYTRDTTCSNADSAISGELADDGFTTAGYNQATEFEVENNQISGDNLIEGVNETTAFKPGLGLGKSYKGSNGMTFADYKYSFNPANNYNQFIPIVMNGSFTPVNIVLSNDGNNYDIRSRNSAKTLGDYDGNGIGYQKIIGAAGYKSLNIRFDECAVIVSYNNGVGTKTGTEVARFNYSDYLKLDEQIAGVLTSYDATSKQLSLDLMYAKDGELLYSGNHFELPLSSYGLNEHDYTLVYNNTDKTDTHIYKPFTKGTRNMYEVVALNSPYVDLAGGKGSAADAMTKNKVYEMYAKNGEITYRKQLVATSNIKSYSLPYNPENLDALKTSYSNKDNGKYGYIANSSYTNSNGFKMSAEGRVVYTRYAHTHYSLTADNVNANMVTGLYDNILDIPGVTVKLHLVENGNELTIDPAVGHPVLNKVEYIVVDDSKVNYGTQGTYNAVAMAKTRDDKNGQYISAAINIQVTITGVIYDYGDAPASYGPGGAKLGGSKNRYNIGINRNGDRANHADAEPSPQFSDDALGDDKLGMSDEDGWFNLEPGGIGELNILMDKIVLSFPYTASTPAEAAFWIDFNENGKFEDWEGQTVSVSPSSYDQYGIVNFKVDLHPAGSTLEPGDITYARVRISSDKGQLTTSGAAKNIDAYGETEDFRVQMYGKQNQYQICTSVLANTPIVTSKSFRKVTGVGPNGDESGVQYTFDIGDPNPNSNSTNSFYPDVKVTVSSKQGITANTGNGDPAFFKVAKDTSPYESTNVIHISSRNKAGQPINLPFTFTFWDLDDFTDSNVVESVSLFKDKMYLEGLDASNVKRTFDSVGIVEDYDTYLKLFTRKQVSSEPSAAFFIAGSSLAKADIEIVEEARLLEIGMGLDLGELTKLITDCIEPFNPKAQIQIFDQFYDNEVNIYNNYPFTYQSTNIAFPYFANFNSVTQNLYIPEGVNFVDGDDSVKIYRRDFLGSRTEKDWELVDPSLYTQTINGTTSSVTFKNPVENKLYGYEYRMQYNFEIDDAMQTGQRVVFKSDVVYNKGKTGEYTETYKLNDVTAIVREAFSLDLNTVMSDDVIHTDTESKVLNYTYEYQNCDTCTNVEEPTPLEGDITIPIPDETEVDFASDKPFDHYEEILFTIYDYDMKVFEVPIRRWYPTKGNVSIEDNKELTQIGDDLNPIGQTIQVRANYALFDDFEEPVKITYNQEVLNIEQSLGDNDAAGGLYKPSNLNISILTEAQDKVPTSWQPTDPLFGQIEVDDLSQIYDPNEVYVPGEDEYCTPESIKDPSDPDYVRCFDKKYHIASFDPQLIDSTLETSKTTINGKDYKDIYFLEQLKTDSKGNVTVTPKLATRYIMDTYNGRMYNSYINNECKLQSEVDSKYKGKICYNSQRYNYNNASSDATKVIAGYNDAKDPDLRVTEKVSNGIPLATDQVTNGEYDYYLNLSKFGLNQTNVSIADKVKITDDSIGYYADEGDYYFKRTDPTKEEQQCIKDGTCLDQYEVLAKGKIEDPLEIRSRINNNTDLLEDYKSVMGWIDTYKKSAIK